MKLKVALCFALVTAILASGCAVRTRKHVDETKVKVVCIKVTDASFVCDLDVKMTEKN